jgi:hypothetical protein
MSLLSELFKAIEDEAAKATWSDQLNEDGDVVVEDFAGGNVDDAFNGGVVSGRVDFARELLQLIKDNT